MSKFSLRLTYSTCKNTKRKPQQQKINVCQLHNNSEFSINLYGVTLRHISSRRLCSQISQQKVTLMFDLNFHTCMELSCRSQWPHGLNCGSAAARLLGLRVRIAPAAWMSVCCECCVLSGRSLCDGLITRPEESYRLWCVVKCDLET